MALDYFTNYGQSWLMEQKTSIGTAVTYKRGSSSVSITATFGQSEFEVIAGDNSSSLITTHDFLVTPSDLILDGSVVEPQKEDTITWTVDGETRVYRVLDRPGLKAFAYDSLRKTLRIRTLFITAG